MDVTVRLLDLTAMHPRLLWDDLAAAAAATLAGADTRGPFPFELTVQDVPAFGSDVVRMTIDPAGLSPDHVARLRRTYEPSRLVELAAVAVAGLGLYHAGGHEIRDVALRGSGADYLVDDAAHLLEVAGRSRRSDFAAAWHQRRERLSERGTGGFYICVVEFETPAGRLAFHP